MAATLVSSNTTIKIATGGTASGTGGTVNLYTNGATEYAEVTISNSSTGVAAAFEIGTTTFFIPAGVSNFVVQPSATFRLKSAATSNISVSWVVFINSP